MEMEPRKPYKKIVTKAKQAIDAAEFDKALQYVLQINMEEIPDQDRPEILLLHALSLYETADRNEALQKIKEALAINPRYAPALDAWGNFLSDEGKFFAAIARYRSATRAEPGLWFPYYHWGYLLKKMGSPKAALRKFNAAIARNADDLEVYIHAGDCAFQLNRMDDALAFYQTAIQKGGNTTDILSRIGNVYLLLGKSEKAVEAYKKSIALNPMEGSGYENWGLLLQKEGKMEEAAAKYEEGLRHVPDFPTLLLRQGELLVSTGKAGEAIQPLEKALRIFLEKVEGEWGMQWSAILAECAYALGSAHKQLADKEKAREYLMTALRFSYNHLNALQELAVLRGIYREHHLAWEFVVEGEVQARKGMVKGLRAYRVAALNLEEALQYAKECEAEIQGSLQAKDITHTGQVATYAGVLARGPLILIQYKDKTG